MTAATKRTAVLISGSGTTLQSLIDEAQTADFPAELALVISNKAGVKGLERADKAGIPTLVIPHKEYESREAFDAAIHEALIAAEIEFVCLAGFMRILTAGFIDQWRGRMLNIHPALLPAFRGNRAPEQVMASDVTITGSTVHAVIPELDAGPIVAQGALPRLADDDLDALKARIGEVEYRLYPFAVRTFLGQRPDIPVTERALFSNNPYVTFDSDLARGDLPSPD